MRLTSLLPLIALVGLSACDSAKLAELTGVKPPAAACTPNPLPACAPGTGAAPSAMAPEAAPAPIATAGLESAPVTGAMGRNERYSAMTSRTRGNGAYAAARHRAEARNAARRAHAQLARRGGSGHRAYGGYEDRYGSEYVSYDRPQVVYVQPRRQEIYVNQEIDRTTSAYGRQVYNTYARPAPRPVAYNGLYREEQQTYYTARQGGYAYHYGDQTPYGDCNCERPAAGRDRSGHLTWPGKGEASRY